MSLGGSPPERTPSEDELMALADGWLPPDRVIEVERWLADNPEPAALVASWRLQTEMLREHFDPVAAEPVPERLKAMMRRRPRMWLVAAAATAAAFVIGVAVGMGSARLSDHRSLETAFVDGGFDAYRLYVSEVRHPVEVAASEEAHLVKWLTRRVDLPVKAPDLSRSGLTLLGGRLVSISGRPAAFLMYEDARSRRVSVILANLGPGSDTAFRYHAEGNTAAFYWKDGPGGYLIAGPADRPFLLSVARAVYESFD